MTCEVHARRARNLLRLFGSPLSILELCYWYLQGKICLNDAVTMAAPATSHWSRAAPATYHLLFFGRNIYCKDFKLDRMLFKVILFFIFWRYGLRLIFFKQKGFFNCLLRRKGSWKQHGKTIYIYNQSNPLYIYIVGLDWFSNARFLPIIKNPFNLASFQNLDLTRIFWMNSSIYS
jgi:hypothetical protein